MVAEPVADESRVDLLLASRKGVRHGTGHETVQHHADQPGDEGYDQDHGCRENVLAFGSHFVETVKRTRHRAAVGYLAESPEHL